MKVLLALVCLVAAAQANKFFPKYSFDDFDKSKYDELIRDNEVNFDTDYEKKPYNYYSKFFPTTTTTDRKYTPFALRDPYYDPTTKYDFTTFSKYFETHPVLSTVSKYFPTTKTVEAGNYDTYFPVPREVTEIVKTSKDLKETIVTLLKYFYNLPEDVRATVVAKYDFVNVIRFLFQVYFDIPNVPHPLTTYYDIPPKVLEELSNYDLKKIIYNVIFKFFDFSPYEREFFSEKIYDLPAVVKTLVKVYYGVPQFGKYDVEYFYYDADFQKYVAEIFGYKFDFYKYIETLFDKRSKLTATEKEFFDRFFNFEEFFNFFVKTYYFYSTSGTEKYDPFFGKNFNNKFNKPGYYKDDEFPAEFYNKFNKPAYYNNDDYPFGYSNNGPYSFYNNKGGYPYSKFPFDFGKYPAAFDYFNKFATRGYNFDKYDTPEYNSFFPFSKKFDSFDKYEKTPTNGNDYYNFLSKFFGKKYGPAFEKYSSKYDF